MRSSKRVLRAMNRGVDVVNGVLAKVSAPFRVYWEAMTTVVVMVFSFSLVWQQEITQAGFAWWTHEGMFLFLAFSVLLIAAAAQHDRDDDADAGLGTAPA